MHYFGLLVAFTYACLHKVQAFVRYNGRISRNSLHLGVTEYDDIDFDDPYGFMGLEKEIVKDGGWNAFSVISENQGRTKIVRKARQNKSEYEKYLESRLGNLDAPMLDGSRWMKRLRESVGRGRRVSKRMLERRITVPNSVSSIIRAVYFDKTHTLNDLKHDREYELKYIEFKKWIKETRKKNRGRAFLPAKRAVAREWIRRTPKMKYPGSSKGRLPPVVMDELVRPPRRVTFGSAKTLVVPQNSFLTIASSAHAISPSMANWEKSYKNLAPSFVGIPSQGSDNIKSVGRPIESFFIDDVQMFIPNNCGDEYFVVL